MSCYCHQVVRTAVQDLAAQSVPGSEPALVIAGAPLLRALANWLGARALPSPPWQPDPVWLDQRLPALTLSGDALATISALAQLRADLVASLGVDPADPGQAGALTRLFATAQARAQDIAALGLDPATLGELAATQHASDQVMEAVRQRLLPVTPERLEAAQSPSMQAWQPWLRKLRALAPLVAAANQLGVDLSGDFAAALSTRLRTLRGITLPPLADGAHLPLARATACLSALAQLRASLGVDTVKASAATLRSLVAARARTAMQSLADATGSTPQKLASLIPADVVARLPALPYCPTSFAAPAVVRAAQAINAEAAAQLTWAVPPATSLGAVAHGMPVLAFALSFQAATGLRPARPAPCGRDCDAASQVRGPR